MSKKSKKDPKHDREAIKLSHSTALPATKKKEKKHGQSVTKPSSVAAIKKTKVAAIDQVQFDKVMLGSARLTETAIAAAKSRALGTSARSVIESLGGLSNPPPDFVASNGKLTDTLAKAELNELLAIVGAVPTVDVGVITLQLGQTALHAPEVRLEEYRGAGARIMSQVGGGNYYAKFVVTNEKPGSRRIDISMQGVIFGANIRKSGQIQWSDAVSTSRSRVVRSAQLEWLTDDPSLIGKFVTETARVAEVKQEKQANKVGKGKRKGQKKSGDEQFGFALQAFCLMSLLDRKSMIVAGGKGKEVKAAVVQAGNAALKSARRGPLSLHPEARPHFWATLPNGPAEAGFTLPLVTHSSVPSGAGRRKIDSTISEPGPKKN